MFEVRHGQYLLMFFCFVSAYIMRLDITVAIVAMTNKASANSDFTELKWDIWVRSKVLSAFFWGYFIPQIPAGILARKFGPTRVLAITTLVGSLSALLIPFVSTTFNWQAVCGVRFVQGFSQGFIHPSIYTHISRWAPANERSRTISIVLCGQQFGSVIALIMTGYLAASPLGWPSVFYTSGLCGMLWTVSWIKWGAVSPAQHRTITLEERAFIEKTEQPVTANRKYESGTPWKSIITTPAVFVLALCHICNNWGFWTLVTMSPSYISSVYGFNIKNNAFFSAMPHLSMFILALVFSSISDFILRKKILSVHWNRKMWNSVAQWGGAVALLCIALFRESQTMTLIMMTVALALNSATFLGFLSNHMDLSPNYAGILMGLTNFLSNIASMAAPLFAGCVLKNEKDANEWAVIFYTASVFFFVSNTLFLLFGSTKVQKWNT